MIEEPTARAFVADLERATRGRTALVLTHRPGLFDAGDWRQVADLEGVATDSAEAPR